MSDYNSVQNVITEVVAYRVIESRKFIRIVAFVRFFNNLNFLSISMKTLCFKHSLSSSSGTGSDIVTNITGTSYSGGTPSMLDC